MGKYPYMTTFIDEGRKRKYTDLELQVLGTMAGSEEAHAVYGSTKKAFEAASEIVKTCATAEEAVKKFAKALNL